VKVARLHAPGDIRVSEEPDPEPGPDDELIRVTAVGLCGSDRHWFAEGGIGDTVLAQPLVLGHEIAGTIASSRYPLERLGAAFDDLGQRRGLKVVVEPST
jgi:L-iditol 2-dehydrogenase